MTNSFGSHEENGWRQGEMGLGDGGYLIKRHGVEKGCRRRCKKSKSD